MPSRFDPNNPSTWGGLLNGEHQQFDAEILPGGAVKLTNIQPHEVESAAIFAKKIGGAIPVSAPSSPAFQQPTPPSSPPVEIVGGITVDEMIQRFKTRKKKYLRPKTFYEYCNYHRKFSAWIALRKGNKNFPIRLVTRIDFAEYIDELLDSGLEAKTVKEKYLSALNGLFELAQSSGFYPEGNLPGRGHKVIPKDKLKELEGKNSYKPFTDEELAKIFLPDNLMKRPKPCDFWLPFLGLFTGGRISELCQLAISDIQLHGDLWALSINDEEYKKLKSTAARRVIPIHPQLIALGFLDYVEDAKQHGPMLFPYLTADEFGNFSPTPSERFGVYLDKLGITHPQKVFHSLRKNSNNKMKQSKVAEETRCQFIGHVYETTNSYDYGEEHDLPYLMEHAASKLVFQGIEFDKMIYPKGRFSKKLAQLCKNHEGTMIRREIKAKQKEAEAKGQVPRNHVPRKKRALDKNS